MTLRTATTDDCEEILGVAERSFQASYSLSPEQIATIVGAEFTADSLAGRIDDSDALLLVAETDDTVAAVADVDLATGRLRWLHVDPIERGQGLGTSLIERAIEELSDSDRSLSAQILEDATEGESFLERFDLKRTDTTSLELGQHEFAAHVYADTGQEIDPNEPDVEVPESVTESGTEHPVDRDEPIPGTKAPFFQTFAGSDRSEQAGFFCSSCGTTEVSVDGMDRVECSECGNKHRADEWDDAYL